MNLANIKEKLIAHALEAVLAGLGAALLAFLALAENYLAQHVQTLAPITIVRTITLLSATALLSLAFAFYHRPKFVFDKTTGTYIDIKTDLRFCTRCKIDKKLHSPLHEFTQGHGWQCEVCTAFYKNPNYESPHEPPKPRRERI